MFVLINLSLVMSHVTYFNRILCTVLYSNAPALYERAEGRAGQGKVFPNVVY